MEINLSDDDILRLVKLEKITAIGFEQDNDLVDDRARALNYYKGEMPDVPALPNRSKAVSSDIADAVETILPDLMEIFTGGDDVVAFTPTKPGDEQQAQQETDYLSHVVFSENDGWLTFHTMFKDALLEKTGIVTFFWDEKKDVSEETFEGKTLQEIAIASQDGEVSDIERLPTVDVLGRELYNFTLTQTKYRAGVKIQAFPPQDFAVAADTVNLNEATYCAFRSRPRAQDLILEGIDRDLVDRLPPARRIGPDDTNDLARDTAGESSQAIAGTGGLGDLRQVEVITHYLRTSIDDSDELKIIKAVTANSESILLKKEIVNRVNFAAITPFLTTHRFYGQSLADKLMEIQRIKTALSRMMLDSGYFALNQRLVVGMDQANSFTISDLLRNEPGVPIRAKTAVGAISPVNAGQLNFDVAGALEYWSTVSESRSGVVRNAQGLNPDTLHDTAKGALALMGMAQRRVRMIARVFAETGIKDLFLGVHALIRENATEQCIARLRGKWMPIDPTTWGERDDMTIEIGLGASGREAESARMAQVLQTTQTIIQMQGGANGPLVTAQNAYNVILDAYQKLGLKQPEKYVSDPSTMQPGQQPQAPPDPKMVAVQLQHQREMAKDQSDERLKREEMAQDFQLKKYEIDTDAKTRLAEAAMGGPKTPLPEPEPTRV